MPFFDDELFKLIHEAPYHSVDDLQLDQPTRAIVTGLHKRYMQAQDELFLSTICCAAIVEGKFRLVAWHPVLGLAVIEVNFTPPQHREGERLWFAIRGKERSLLEDEAPAVADGR